MTQSENQAIWQERIATFQASGEPSVAAWCRDNNIHVKSMYHWLKKERSMKEASLSAPTWLPIDIQETSTKARSTLTVKIGRASIEIASDFDPSLFDKIVQVLQRHVE